jgi:uncharacterized protein YacL
MDINDRKTISQSIREIPAHIKLMVRSLTAFVLFILGFNFSRSQFFEEYPLFNVDYLAEILLSFLAAAIGFFIIPNFIMTVTHWIERMIYSTVDDIVTTFWDQQSMRIRESRREKKNKKVLDVKEKIQQELSHGILLDTSIMIDGRIIDLVKTGFLENVFIVPQFVVDELHKISDSKDDLKRQKGRRGLDILKKLRKSSKVYVPENSKKKIEVDKELVVFAKLHKLRLMTLDFNLNKVAGVANVRVLNINDLTNAVKTVFIPGEEIAIKIIHEGKERKQGVGYLEDGTMIVVEDTKDKVNKNVNALVTKVIQSSAGKIIFCDLA